MAELFLEVVSRNGNYSGNGGKILSTFNFSVSDWLKCTSFNILHNQLALTKFGRRLRYPVKWHQWYRILPEKGTTTENDYLQSKLNHQTNGHFSWYLKIPYYSQKGANIIIHLNLVYAYNPPHPSLESPFSPPNSKCLRTNACTAASTPQGPPLKNNNNNKNNDNP